MREIAEGVRGTGGTHRRLHLGSHWGKQVSNRGSTIVAPAEKHGLWEVGLRCP